METLECLYSAKTGFEQQIEEIVENLPSQSQSQTQLQLQHNEQHQQQQQQQQLSQELCDEETSAEQTEKKNLSPNKVGHEFVKQYYRILYKAPEILHRFYTNDSTCTRHDYNMIIGKREIQQLFQRENYRKCRTNIFNTDIHGTIANGVIVLVTGEQSNLGSPMRSFVQTFVLAAEGPRKYYVCNDIFRYADIFAKSAAMKLIASAALVDVECQTSSMHIGDGDRESLESSVENVEIVGVVQHQQQQQQQQLTSKAPVYDFYKTATVTMSGGNGGCGVACHAIPMPRWASSRPSRDSSVSGNFTHNFSQQENFTIQTADSENNISENLHLASDFQTSQHHDPHAHHQLEQQQLEREQQPIYEYPCYRSLIAQALSPRLEFEEITTTPTMSNQYVNAVYYNEDVTRASVGVSSLRVTKRRSVDSQQQQHHQRQLYAMQSNEDQINGPIAATPTNEVQENQPQTYAKLFMNSLTRTGMKNSSSNNSTIMSNKNIPLKAANTMSNLFNAQRSQNIEPSTTVDLGGQIKTKTPSAVSHSHQAATMAMHGGMHQHHPHQQQQHHHHHQQQHADSVVVNNYAPGAGATAAVHSQDYSSVQRNNYSNSSSNNNNNNNGMRRNDRRRSSSAQKYNDNQQLFLGQIPHNATEEELVRIFSCFGNVLELRILPNLNGKIQPGAKHPLKYGFLTFEHVESVKTCLESRPVYFPNNSPDGQKLNVRAKKPAVSRDEQMPANCQQSLDSQSMTSEWPQTRRNNSISSASTIGSSAAGSATGGGVPNLSHVFNRKDNNNNRNVRAASLDNNSNSTATQQSPTSTVAAGGGGGNSGGNRKFAQAANGCGRR